MRSRQSSFQRRLLGNFLVAGAVPLAVCVALILGLFQATLSQSVQREAAAQLSAAKEELEKAVSSCDAVLTRLGQEERVASLLAGSVPRDTGVYTTLYTAAALLTGGDCSLYDRQGVLLYTTGSAVPGEDLPTDWGLLWQARERGGLVCRRVFPREGEGRMELCRAVERQGETVGYAVVRLTQSHFQQLFAGKCSPGTDLLVLDPFWDLVYATLTQQNDGLVPRLRECLLSGRALTDGEGDYSYYVDREEVSGFTLLLRQPRPLGVQTMRLFNLIALVSILLCFLLCLYFSMGFSRRIFAPIFALNSAMARVEEGDLEARVPVEGVDELSQLSGRFNRMAQRLKTNLAQSVRQQQELGDAQIRMMQAQLNPHFLYNTLDTLKWLGKINRVEEVSTISADLADILRRSISAAEFVPLREELALLDRYVEIQRIRFPGKFTYLTEVEEEARDVLVPKLMLQPLVENAVIHGFEDGSRGQIRVTAQCQGEELLLTVRDDGMGMSPESRERFLTRRPPQAGRGHLGLYNVDAILRLHYGEDRGLTLLGTERGTAIRAVLPIRYGGDEE